MSKATFPFTTYNGFQTERGKMLHEVLEARRAGMPDELIELTEKQVCPWLINASIRTLRDSRRTGTLLGKPAPKFIKRGSRVWYRLSDVFAWLNDCDVYSNTSEALLGGAA